MKTRIAVCLAVGFASLLHAQPLPNPIPSDNQQRQNPNQNQNNNNANNTATVQGFWQANLPGGNFIVQVNRITSVSRHRYLLDGALVVDEVTVDTTGQALARFYFISPVGAGGTVGDTANAALQQGKGLLDAAGQKVGVDLDNMVIKKYPDTTHARTIEYRIPTESQLTSLFNSAKQAWQTGQGGQFTVQLK